MSDIQISKGVKARHTHDSPIYGTELVYDQNKAQGVYRIMIITAYFDGNSLVGNRSVWYVDALRKMADLKGLDVYDVAEREWIPYLGGASHVIKVWNKHRKALATFLMEQWDLGKLHGRINDELHV